MKKKVAAFIIAAVCVAVLAWPIPASAQDYSGTCGDNITWEYDSATKTLTFSGQGDMELGDDVPWSDCKEATVVVVGEGITSLGRHAFGGFTEMTSVSLPKTLTKIGEGAFSYCRGLTQAPLNNNITVIGSYAFDSCSGFTEVTIPAKVKSIGRSAFSGCLKLSKLTISNGVQEICDDAFAGCCRLTDVVISDSVSVIGGGAFSGCSALKSVTLSKKLKEISWNLFSGCSKLTEVTIPDSVTAIGGYAFTDCTSLQKVVIGAGVKQVEVTAFWGCAKLQKFTLSAGNRTFEVSEGVLYNKAEKKLVLMPQGFTGVHTVVAGTKIIGDNACHECAKLTGIIMPDTVTETEEYALCHCTSLKKVTLSENMKVIGPSSFAFCTGLEEVKFPKSLENIEGAAFSDCTRLKSVTFLGDKPLISYFGFDRTDLTAYYPGSNATWKGINDSYGGFITWKAINCNGKHTPVTIKGTAASCTKPGLSEGRCCSVCGEILTPQKQITMDHSYGSWVEVTPATAQKEGVAQRKCSLCGKVEQKTLPKTEQAMGRPIQTTPVKGQEETELPETVPQTEEGTETQQPQSETVEETVEQTQSESDDTEGATAQSEERDNTTTDRPGTVVAIAVAVGMAAVGGGALGYYQFKKRRSKNGG